jgi:hypothetical protein
MLTGSGGDHNVDVSGSDQCSILNGQFSSERNGNFLNDVPFG